MLFSMQLSSVFGKVVSHVKSKLQLDFNRHLKEFDKS